MLKVVFSDVYCGGRYVVDYGTFIWGEVFYVCNVPGPMVCSSTETHCLSISQEHTLCYHLAVAIVEVVLRYHSSFTEVLLENCLHRLCTCTQGMNIIRHACLPGDSGQDYDVFTVA